MKEHFEYCYPEVIDTQELYKEIIRIFQGMKGWFYFEIEQEVGT